MGTKYQKTRATTPVRDRIGHLGGAQAVPGGEALRTKLESGRRTLSEHAPEGLMHPAVSWGALGSHVAAAKGSRGARAGGGVSARSLVSPNNCRLFVLPVPLPTRGEGVDNRARRSRDSPLGRAQSPKCEIENRKDLAWAARWTPRPLRPLPRGQESRKLKRSLCPSVVHLTSAYLR